MTIACPTASAPANSGRNEPGGVAGGHAASAVRFAGWSFSTTTRPAPRAFQSCRALKSWSVEDLRPYGVFFVPFRPLFA
jgi:hypothetical protein